jgi:hypothetical protein
MIEPLTDTDRAAMESTTTVSIVLPHGEQIEVTYGFRNTFNDFIQQLDDVVENEGLHDLYDGHFNWITSFKQLENSTGPFYMLGSLSRHAREGQVKICLQLKHERKEIFVTLTYKIQYYQRLLAMTRNRHPEASQVWIQNGYRISNHARCSALNPNIEVVVLFQAH